ncbi:MAG: hypothetical protein AAF675_02315 [Pseudomonadota bacterium]
MSLGGETEPAVRDPALPPEDLLALIAAGEAMLAREREACLAGAFVVLPGLAAEKRAFAGRLEAALAQPEAGAPLDRGRIGQAMAGLARLQETARANERLLAAMRAGVRRAARELARMAASRRGAVAYARDGSEILSREDAAGRSRRA